MLQLIVEHNIRQIFLVTLLMHPPVFDKFFDNISAQVRLNFANNASVWGPTLFMVCWIDALVIYCPWWSPFLLNHSFNSWLIWRISSTKNALLMRTFTYRKREQLFISLNIQFCYGSNALDRPSREKKSGIVRTKRSTNLFAYLHIKKKLSLQIFKMSQ